MSDPEPENSDTRGAEWMGFGIVIGLSLGAGLGLMTDNRAPGVATGVSLGVGFGGAMMASKNTIGNDED